jgi:hypothetical protein
MKISYIIVAHQNPSIVIRLVDTLVKAGHTVALHYDKKASQADYDQIVRAFQSNLSVRFARRMKVRWGQWSICKATLNCIEEIAAAGWEPDYVYYASGSDYPIRSSEELVAFLTRNKGKEFIEGVPTDKQRWVKGGPQEERYQYRFWFNWREQYWRATTMLKIQKKLGLKRKFPLGLEPYMGSQWWVLTWKTLNRVMEFANRPEIVRFFETTLIPDELFFQTLVCNTVPASRIVSRPLTLYQFSDYMVPVIYCADRVEYLLRQPFFMARKLSAHRRQMYDVLDEVWFGRVKTAPFTNDRVATISPEYEDHRLKHRDGIKGTPLYGKPIDRWYEDLARVEETFFAVIGLSVSELNIAYRFLSCSQKIRCHGQIFHPNCIEFSYGASEFAGYECDAIQLRNSSAPNFLANLVRAEPNRMTGFLVKSGHGWHVPEIIFNRPNPRALLLRGDPLIAFAESICGGEFTLNDRIDWNMIDTMPPSILARKWREFMPDFDRMMENLDSLVKSGIEKKQHSNWGWLTEVDFDLTRPSRLHSQNIMRIRSDLAGWAGMTLARWRDWFIPAGKNLGVQLSNVIPTETSREVTTMLASLEAGRKMLISGLAAGGVTIASEYDPADIDEPFIMKIKENRVR